MRVYISVENGDDRLSQVEWARFVMRIDGLLDHLEDDRTATVHGRWFSPSDSPWQSACWCVEIVEDPPFDHAGWLREKLAEAAGEFRQDSITWAVAKTELIAAPSDG